MIRFSLICEMGHRFDAWFSCGDSYEEQTEAGAISCPDCGSPDVRKAPMAPAVLRGRREAADDRAEDRAEDRTGADRPSVSTPQEGRPDRDGAPDGERTGSGRTYAFLKGLREHLEANADDVGKDFAREARKMHYGEAAERSIYGQATADEAKSLHEEGIPALPLPKLPEEHN